MLYHSIIKNKRKLLIVVLANFALLNAQESNKKPHLVLLKDAVKYVENQHFKQGTNWSPSGDTLSLNNYFLKENSKAILPIMGEFQYSRYPKKEWETALLKMKASGIEIIGFYDFWIHHEEKEGQFRFDDNLDVKAFLELIQKHHLKAVARIGPWVHGETRNGGYPDWFVKKYMKSGFDRVSKNGEVVSEVEIWYRKLAEQFKGFYYKDGGPIIGIQLDNEVRSNGPKSWGYEYQKTLKKVAQEAGMDVPLYVVTGWPGNNLPEDDVLPLWGGYPAAPWTGNSKPLAANKLYNFVTDRKDKTIGNDIIDYSDAKLSDQTPLYRHPFLTVEMGGGIQDTYHRRPVIAPKDLMGLIYTRLGVGANMMGYYIYHGVQHPLSWDNEYGTQESKGSIYPYPNDYPIISYDFQAPISEYGFLTPSYNYFKRIHQFLQSYGETLAPMIPTIPNDSPKNPEDFENLRYSIRSKNGSGFIFINNFVKDYPMPKMEDVSFDLKAENKSIRVPATGGITIPEGTQAIFPFNQEIENVNLVYATAHPQIILKQSKPIHVYYQVEGINPEFKFKSENIANIKVSNGKSLQQSGFTFVNDLKAGKNCTITINPVSGKEFSILVLNEKEALQTYVFNIKGQENLVMSENGAFYDETKQQLHLTAEGKSHYAVYSYPALNSATKNFSGKGKEAVFYKYEVNNKVFKDIKIPFKDITNEKAFQTHIDSLGQNTPIRPTYDIAFTKNNSYRNYSLKLPKNLPANVIDLQLKFNYQGNTAALYANDLIAADDYFNGKPMIISLKRLAEKSKETVVLQITPLLKNHKIFFESKVNLDFTETNMAKLNNIQIVPIYEIILQL